MEDVGSVLVGKLRSWLEESENNLRFVESAPEEHIHDCRRNGKRIVAVLELLRSSLGEPLFRRLRSATRDGNRLLARPRRAAVLLTTLKEVRVAPGTKAELKDQLKTQCAPDPDAVQQALQCLHALREGLADWPSKNVDPDAIRQQFALSREQLRTRRRRARKKPSPKRLHALRKRLRRYAVQLKQLERLDLSAKKRLPKKYAKLDSLLGKVNDLHDLELFVSGDSDTDTALARPHREELLRSITKRRKRQTRALVRAHLD